jgi:hypothetical protein
VFVLIGFFAADERFVDFNDAGELLEIATAAGFPQTVQDEPSRLLRDPDLLRQLHTGDALAGRHKQVHRVNPLVQGNVAALENRAGAHRKVFLALVTAVEAIGPCRDTITHTADRTTRTIRPKPPFQIDPSRLGIREHLEKLEGRNRDFVRHNRLAFGLKSSPKK